MPVVTRSPNTPSTIVYISAGAGAAGGLLLVVLLVVLIAVAIKCRQRRKKLHTAITNRYIRTQYLH